MYKIYADDTLIYDSTLDLYRIAKGTVSLEVNKSGSATISIYPDHPYYDNFVKMKTVITITKSGKIVFRGRVLNDVTDYWNNKVLTCGGEMDFLQDSVIRPFTFNGTPEQLFTKFVQEHNAQVDEFKRFKIGTVTVTDPNNYIARSNSEYESALSNMSSRLIEDSLGGYFYITHGEDGTDNIPTLHYLSDFTKVSDQSIEFGANLKDYTKTVKADDIATAIIPLGAEVDDGNDDTDDLKLTIAKVNNGLDYVYSEEGVALYGWIFKTVEWDDVTDAKNLKTKAQAYVEEMAKQNITIEVTAVDLHMINPSVESFNVCEYIRVTSAPHNFDATLLCTKQTIDLLKPDNDTYTLGYTYSSFTEMTSKSSTTISKLPSLVKNEVVKVDIKASEALSQSQTTVETVDILIGDMAQIIAQVNANTQGIADNDEDIANLNQIVSELNTGGGGGGGSINGKAYFTDQSTGLYYVLQVVNGKLTMDETTDVPSAMGYMTMYDESAKKYYYLKVINGKLTMSEVV